MRVIKINRDERVMLKDLIWRDVTPDLEHVRLLAALENLRNDTEAEVLRQYPPEDMAVLARYQVIAKTSDNERERNIATDDPVTYSLDDSIPRDCFERWGGPHTFEIRKRKLHEKGRRPASKWWWTAFSEQQRLSFLTGARNDGHRVTLPITWSVDLPYGSIDKNVLCMTPKLRKRLQAVLDALDAFGKAKAALCRDYTLLVDSIETWDALLDIWPEAIEVQLPRTPSGAAQPTAMVVFDPQLAMRVKADAAVRREKRACS